MFHRNSKSAETFHFGDHTKMGSETKLTMIWRAILPIKDVLFSKYQVLHRLRQPDSFLVGFMGGGRQTSCVSVSKIALLC